MSELPNGWVETELKSIQLDDSASLNPANFKDTIYEMYSVPSYETNSPEYLKGSEIGSSKKLVSTGSVLLCRINPRINRVWIVGNHSEYQKLASTEWVIFEQVNGIENKYLQYFLMKPDFRDYLQMNVSGVGGSLTRANKAAIANYPLWLPPHAEQKRIVEKIEALFSRLDAGIAALEKTKAQLNRYKQSVLISKFEALKNATNATKTIGELFKVETGATPKRGVAKYWENGTVPWITSTAVNQKAITVYQELITDDAVKETNAKIYPKGSLIMAMYGEGKTRGMVSELCIEASSNQACAAIIFNRENEYYKDYIRLYLLMSYEETRRGSSGGVQPNLNLTKVRNIEFPQVSGSQSKSVTREIEKHFSLADKALETVEQELKKAQALKSKILEYAFTGKLVPQNPDDEPAEKLLERIKAEKESSKPTKKTIKRK